MWVLYWLIRLKYQNISGCHAHRLGFKRLMLDSHRYTEYKTHLFSFIWIRNYLYTVRTGHHVVLTWGECLCESTLNVTKWLMFAHEWKTQRNGDTVTGLNHLLMVPKSQERHGILHQGLLSYLYLFTERHIICLVLWWRVPVCFFKCVARMAVFLLMQVALREREWSSLTGLWRGWWVVTLQPPSTPCAWAYSVMKWPVSWRSKQWVYSTWSEISVETRLSIIPLIQSYSPSFHPTIFYSVYCPLCLSFSFSFLLFNPPSRVLMFSCTCLYKISYVIVHIWSEHHPFSHWNHFGFIITASYYMFLGVWGVSFVLSSSVLIFFKLSNYIIVIIHTWTSVSFWNFCHFLPGHGLGASILSTQSALPSCVAISGNCSPVSSHRLLPKPQPDITHLHRLFPWFLNIKLLFHCYFWKYIFCTGGPFQ